MSLVKELAAAALTDLGAEGVKDESIVLGWLDKETVSAVDALVGIAEHAVSNSTLGEHLAHGTIERTLENAKAPLATLIEGDEQTLYEGLAKFVSQEAQALGGA